MARELLANLPVRDPSSFSRMHVGGKPAVSGKGAKKEGEEMERRLRGERKGGEGGLV